MTLKLCIPDSIHDRELKFQLIFRDEYESLLLDTVRSPEASTIAETILSHTYFVARECAQAEKLGVTVDDWRESMHRINQQCMRAHLAGMRQTCRDCKQ